MSIDTKARKHVAVRALFEIFSIPEVSRKAFYFTIGV